MADTAALFRFCVKQERKDRPDMMPRATASTSSSSLDPGSPVRRGLIIDTSSEEEEGEEGDVFPAAAEVSTPSGHLPVLQDEAAPQCTIPPHEYVRKGKGWFVQHLVEAEQEGAGHPGEVPEEAGQGAEATQKPKLWYGLPANTPETAIPNLRRWIAAHGASP